MLHLSSFLHLSRTLCQKYWTPPSTDGGQPDSEHFIGSGIVGLKVANERDIGGTHVNCLPPETLALVFTMLDVRTRLWASGVCRTWRQVAHREALWRDTMVELDLGDPERKQPLNKNDHQKLELGIQDLFERGLTQQIPGLALTVRKLLGSEARHFPHLTSVRLRCIDHLNLRGLAGTDTHFKLFSQTFTHVKELELINCEQLTDLSLIFIADHLTRLKRLVIRRNDRITDKGIAYLSGWNGGSGSGGALGDAGNALNAEFPGYMLSSGFQRPLLGSDCLRLEELVLSRCDQLTDQSFLYLSVCQKESLKILTIIHNHHLTNVGLSHLAQFDNLVELNLIFCSQITNEGLIFPGKIESLHVWGCDRLYGQWLVSVVRKASSLKRLSVNIKFRGDVREDLVPLNLASLDQFFIHGIDVAGDLKRVQIGMGEIRAVLRKIHRHHSYKEYDFKQGNYWDMFGWVKPSG